MLLSVMPRQTIKFQTIKEINTETFFQLLEIDSSDEIEGNEQNVMWKVVTVRYWNYGYLWPPSSWMGIFMSNF